MSIKNLYKNQRLSAQIIEFNLNPENKFEDRSRQSHCLNTPRNTNVTIDLFKSPEALRAYYATLQTCGSVWTCPVCAQKISEHRKEEIITLVEKAQAAGKYIYMFTWTLPHYRHESCRTVLDRFNKTTRQMKHQKELKKSPLFKPWSTLLKKYKNDGYIVNKEVLYGQNGWHVHSHGLFIFDEKIKDQLQARENFFEAWLKACDLNFKIADAPGHVLKAFVKRSFSLDKLSGDAKKIYSEYLTKSGIVKKEKQIKDWGLEHEMTKGHLKKSEYQSLTPFGMLDKIRELNTHSKQSIFLKKRFFEYTQAFSGVSFIRWSKGLRQQYEIHWKTDQEIVENKDREDDFYGMFEIPEFKQIQKLKLRGFVIQNSDKDWNTLVEKLNKKIKERNKKYDKILV